MHRCSSPLVGLVIDEQSEGHTVTPVDLSSKLWQPQGPGGSNGALERHLAAERRQSRRRQRNPVTGLRLSEKLYKELLINPESESTVWPYSVTEKALWPDQYGPRSIPCGW